MSLLRNLGRRAFFLAKRNASDLSDSPQPGYYGNVLPFPIHNPAFVCSIFTITTCLGIGLPFHALVFYLSKH